MSYEPTVWKNGDVITPEKLNKIEQGVAGGGGAFIIEWDGESRLDVSYKDIADALNAGKRVEMRKPAGEGGCEFYHLEVVSYKYATGFPDYQVFFANRNGSIAFFSATSIDPLQTSGGK